MSEKMIKISGGGREPIDTYYQFKPAEHPKVKVLAKGQEIVGVFEYTHVEGMYKNHIIKTENEGKVQVKGCFSLNTRLETLSVGARVKIVYLGKGKAKPNKLPPYLFEVYLLEATAPKKATKALPEPDLSDIEDADESDSDDDIAF